MRAAAALSRERVRASVLAATVRRAVRAALATLQADDESREAARRPDPRGVPGRRGELRRSPPDGPEARRRGAAACIRRSLEDAGVAPEEVWCLPK